MVELDNKPYAPPVMISIREAAQRGPLTMYALRTLQKSGTLPGIQIGGKFFVNYTNLLNLLNEERRLP